MTQPTSSTIILSILPNASVSSVILVKVEREKEKKTLFFWFLPDKKRHGNSKEQDTETNPARENSFLWRIFPLQDTVF